MSWKLIQSLNKKIKKTHQFHVTHVGILPEIVLIMAVLYRLCYRT